MNISSSCYQQRGPICALVIASQPDINPTLKLTPTSLLHPSKLAPKQRYPQPNTLGPLDPCVDYRPSHAEGGKGGCSYM